MAEDDIVMSRGAADLFAGIVGANVTANKSLSDQLWSRDLANRCWLEQGIIAALAGWDEVQGGTTRDYERLLGRFGVVLHPPEHVKTLYHDYADRYIAGDPGDPPPYPLWAEPWGPA